MRDTGLSSTQDSTISGRRSGVDRRPRVSQVIPKARRGLKAPHFPGSVGRERRPRPADEPRPIAPPRRRARQGLERQPRRGRPSCPRTSRGPVAEPAGRRALRARGGLGRPGAGGRPRSRRARPRAQHRAGLRRRLGRLFGFLRAPRSRAAARGAANRRALPQIAGAHSGRDGPGMAVTTLRRRLSAIGSRHTTAHHDTPTDHPLVRRLVARYARTRGPRRKRRRIRSFSNRSPRCCWRCPTINRRAVTDSCCLGMLERSGAPNRRPGRPRPKILEEGGVRLDRGGEKWSPQSRAPVLRPAPTAA